MKKTLYMSTSVKCVHKTLRTHSTHLVIRRRSRNDGLPCRRGIEPDRDFVFCLTRFGSDALEELEELDDEPDE